MIQFDQYWGKVRICLSPPIILQSHLKNYYPIPITINNHSEQNYKLGIKSGVFAGLIYGGLFSLLIILLLTFLPILPQMHAQFLEVGIGKKAFYALYIENTIIYTENF